MHNYKLVIKVENGKIIAESTLRMVIIRLFFQLSSFDYIDINSVEKIESTDQNNLPFANIADCSERLAYANPENMHKIISSWFNEKVEITLDINN